MNQLVLQDMFDKDVAPFQQKYMHLVEDIHGVYGNAKEVKLKAHTRRQYAQAGTACLTPVCSLQFHAKGIQMLIDEFNYHVAYKRWDDTFNATPFKPK